MNTPPKKRFIAGASCPKCQTLDSIVLFEQDSTSYRECISCDFKQNLQEYTERTNNNTQTVQWLIKEKNNGAPSAK